MLLIRVDSKTTDPARVSTTVCTWQEGKIHRVDPDFGSTLTGSNRDSQSNRWVNWKIMGQPCEFQVRGGWIWALCEGTRIAIRYWRRVRRQCVCKPTLCTWSRSSEVQMSSTTSSTRWPASACSHGRRSHFHAPYTFQCA
jgi:hypothetical protein